MRSSVIITVISMSEVVSLCPLGSPGEWGGGWSSRWNQLQTDLVLPLLRSVLATELCLFLLCIVSSENHCAQTTHFLFPAPPWETKSPAIAAILILFPFILEFPMFMVHHFAFSVLPINLASIFLSNRLPTTDFDMWFSVFSIPALGPDQCFCCSLFESEFHCRQGHHVLSTHTAAPIFYLHCFINIMLRWSLLNIHHLPQQLVNGDIVFCSLFLRESAEGKI